MRADQALVARGLAPSRTAAQRLIADGAVRLSHGIVLRRPAQDIHDLDALEVLPSDETRFVSRAGAKLLHALHHFGLQPSGRMVLDLGQSTGGFTDCLLQLGATRVVGIDVGHGQLHARLRADPRVTCIEHTHVRDLDLPGLNARVAEQAGAPGAGCSAETGLGSLASDTGYAMAVVDLSFISLTRVLRSIDGLLAACADVLLLVKPQFELGPDALDRRGVVRSEALARQALAPVEAEAQTLGWSLLGRCESSVRGTDGNLEFFLHARTGPARGFAGSSP